MADCYSKMLRRLTRRASIHQEAAEWYSTSRRTTIGWLLFVQYEASVLMSSVFRIAVKRTTTRLTRRLFDEDHVDRNRE